jgi:hypothetical protein
MVAPGTGYGCAHGRAAGPPCLTSRAGLMKQCIGRVCSIARRWGAGKTLENM